MTDSKLKIEAQTALLKRYGFCPTRDSIKLLEASDDGSYIMIEVGILRHQYQIYRETKENTIGSFKFTTHDYKVEEYILRS